MLGTWPLLRSSVFSIFCHKKTAMLVGKSGIAERPLVLDSDVQRMCEELGNDRLGQTAPWQREANSIGGMKWWTGCHCSSSGGVDRAVINAAATGIACSTIGPFTCISPDKTPGLDLEVLEQGSNLPILRPTSSRVNICIYSLNASASTHYQQAAQHWQSLCDQASGLCAS